MVKLEEDGNNKWSHRDKKTAVSDLFEHNLEELLGFYEAERVPLWRQWYKGSGLAGDGYDKTETFKDQVNHVEQVLLDER